MICITRITYFLRVRLSPMRRASFLREPKYASKGMTNLRETWSPKKFAACLAKARHGNMNQIQPQELQIL